MSSLNAYISSTARDALAGILEALLKDGAEGSRDLDAALDAILCTIQEDRAQAPEEVDGLNCTMYIDQCRKAVPFAKLRDLWMVGRNFIDAQEISCAEATIEDRVYENAPELVEKIGDIVGYCDQLTIINNQSAEDQALWEAERGL